jgi:hypothetical protein
VKNRIIAQEARANMAVIKADFHMFSQRLSQSTIVVFSISNPGSRSIKGTSKNSDFVIPAQAGIQRF